MTLYEINQAILDCVDEETGEILDTELLDKLQLDRRVKIENIALFTKSLLAEAKAIAEEKKALEAREKARKRTAERLKEYLCEQLDGQKYHSARVDLGFRKSDTLEIKSTDNIPAEFLVPQAPKVDKMALKKAVKAGAVFEGVELIVKQNLQIK